MGHLGISAVNPGSMGLVGGAVGGRAVKRNNDGDPLYNHNDSNYKNPNLMNPYAPAVIY